MNEWMKWMNEMTWHEMKWHEMKWNDMKWNEMNELINELNNLMKFMKLMNAWMKSLGKEWFNTSYTTHRMHMIYDTNKCSLSLSLSRLAHCLCNWSWGGILWRDSRDCLWVAPTKITAWILGKGRAWRKKQRFQFPVSWFWEWPWRRFST